MSIFFSLYILGANTVKAPSMIRISTEYPYFSSVSLSEAPTYYFALEVFLKLQTMHVPGSFSYKLLMISTVGLFRCHDCNIRPCY
jgi:hypothetical protein